VSLVPRSFALAEGPPVAMLKLAPGKLKVPVSILYRADRARPPAAEAFLKSVRERFKGRPQPGSGGRRSTPARA
jgi:DNA-binding transcriptional LysR family regulator